MGHKIFYAEKTKFSNLVGGKNLKFKYFLLISVVCILLSITTVAQQNLAAESPVLPDTMISSNNDKVLLAGNFSQAAFPGGDDEWAQFLTSHIRMPNYRKKFTGAIVVTFTIMENGKLGDLQASDGPGPLRHEALRVIKKSGKWFPAYKNGRPVASARQQKISFLID